MLKIVEAIELNPAMKKQDRKGIISRSPFLNLDYFDFVHDIPVDYMHTACLGVVKCLIVLCFNVGEKRPRLVKRKLSSPAKFNSAMSSVKVPHEFSRRGRNLDFSVLKAQEFRNIILFFFPFVISCFELEDKEISLWLYLAFAIRACVLPENEFQNVQKTHVKKVMQKFYILYEKLFGATNCSYNTHVLCSHLLDMRKTGSLTATSCFGFENFYSELRNSFVRTWYTIAFKTNLYQMYFNPRSI